MSWFCKHEWEVLVNEHVPSQAELQMDAHLKVCEMAAKHGSGKVKAPEGNVPSTFFESTTIIILKCLKCGKIDKTVERV